MKDRNHIRPFLAPLLFMLLIFLSSSISFHADNGAHRNVLRQIIQNILHIPLFGMLSVLWIKSFFAVNVPKRKAAVLTIIIVLFYAVFDELHQYFIPGRYCSLDDFLLDAVGCIAGILVYMRFMKDRLYANS